jgi:hypothetical protein
MKTMYVKFKEPKVKQVRETIENGKVVKLFVQLDWYGMGIGNHTIYMKDDMFVWTDRQSPIPVRKFPCIESLMWEYELPKSLKVKIEKLSK